MEIGECNRLLVMLVVQLERGPSHPAAGSTLEMSLIVGLLRLHYIEAGSPYGDDEQGFQRWLLDHWPAPPMA